MSGASSKNRVVSSSSRRIAVSSRTVPISPTIVPALSRNGALMTETVRSAPPSIAVRQ
jgi:hypothetical protein